jgi:antitoxin PrlF
VATLAITALLESVEADIVAHPERIRIFGGAMHDRLKALVGDTNVDLEQPLSPDDE